MDYTRKQYLSMILEQVGLKHHAKNVLKASEESERLYTSIVRMLARSRSDVRELAKFAGIITCETISQHSSVYALPF